MSDGRVFSERDEPNAGSPTQHQDRVLELSIVMPCLNEEVTLGACIDEALAYLTRSGVSGEIIVADNGSVDDSVNIARSRGARVVHVQRRGYGEALRAGMAAAAGDWVVMGDSDMSYDFGNLDAFVEALRSGSDVVVGNRFAGGIEPGAMPALHRYLGNPVLSFIARHMFSIPVGDFHCGLRAVRRDTAGLLPYRSSGMEFASEMIVRCSFAGMKITEVPTVLRPDGRDRDPHLRRWSDGWRHLRLLFLYSPRWLFFYPGLVAVVLAAAMTGIALAAESQESGLRFSIAAVGLWGIGMQSVSFAVLTKVWGARLDLLPGDVRVARFADSFPLGHLLFVALAGLLAGAVFLAIGLGQRHHGIDQLDILGIGSMVLSVQLGLNSCLVGVSTL